MAEAILDTLGPMLTRWTMGGSAIAAAPAPWREALGEEPGEAELRLLALASQFLGAMTLAEPSGEVRALADIPRLSRPTLPDALRPRARRLLQQTREGAMRRHLLEFVDTRGWTLHPADWMPAAGEDVPETYAPWQDWAAAAKTSPAFKTSPSAEGVTAEDWDALGPAARRVAFAALRRRDPAAASALLAQKIATETADSRLRLLEALAIGLSEADRPLLESLSADRAARVKALAGSLLARLGHGEAAGEDAAELAGFFALESRGFLRRSRAVVPQALKTPAQEARRAALMDSVPLDAFAGALGLTAETLTEAWSFGADKAADRLLSAMVGRSGADQVVAALASALTQGAIDTLALSPLLPRLGPGPRRRAAEQALRLGQGGFAAALEIAGGAGGIDDVVETPAGQALLSALTAAEAPPGERAGELLTLGLLASRRAARQALDQLAAAGLIASDPRLDMLRLNAALEEQGTKE